MEGATGVAQRAGGRFRHNAAIERVQTWVLTRHSFTHNRGPHYSQHRAQCWLRAALHPVTKKRAALSRWEEKEGWGGAGGERQTGDWGIFVYEEGGREAEGRPCDPWLWTWGTKQRDVTNVSIRRSIYFPSRSHVVNFMSKHREEAIRAFTVVQNMMWEKQRLLTDGLFRIPWNDFQSMN